MVDRRRQWRAENQDISIIDQLGRRVYVVSGSRGHEYTVDLEEPACDCPDWKKREPEGGCKHILYVKLQQGKIESLPSAKTNFGSYENRSSRTYDSNWPRLSRRTCKRDNWTCQKCGAKGGSLGPASVEAHHIVPKSKGGEDRLDNLITLCRGCHEEQHGHVIPEGGQYTARHSGGGMEESDLDAYVEAGDTGSRNRRTDSPCSSSGLDPEMGRSQRGYRQPDEETTASGTNGSVGDEYSSESSSADSESDAEYQPRPLDPQKHMLPPWSEATPEPNEAYTSESYGTYSDNSTENSSFEQTSSSNTGSSQNTARTREPASSETEDENVELTVGQELVAGLFFTIVVWVILEAIFYFISWGPGTSSNRFLLILLAFEVLMLLPEE